MNRLLTPDDVADLLQMSVKTVYAHSKRLGGFRPAGIRMIRFRPEVIRDIMEGQGERLEVSVPAPGGAVQQPTLSDKGGSVMACGYGMVSEIDKKRCTKKADEVTCKKCLKYIVPQKQGQ